MKGGIRCKGACAGPPAQVPASQEIHAALLHCGKTSSHGSSPVHPMKSIRWLLPCLVLQLLSPSPAFAWSEQGHWLIGELASRQLTAPARTQVTWLLEGETVPTLAGVSTWADEIRPGRPATAPWHFINSQDGTCNFVPPRDCPDGSCAPGAIEAQMKILADTTLSRDQRREALKFVVHFVGDLHQPMHADPRDDAGGNRYQISLRTDVAPSGYELKHPGKGTNLHAVWDYYVLGSRHLGNQAYAAALQENVPHIPAENTGTPWDWAHESCALVDSHAIYPQGHILDDTYLNAQRPLAEQRVTLAAARLANLLNQALGSGSNAGIGR